MKTQRIVEILKSGVVDTDIVVKGWVRTKRGNKNVAFIALNDGSCVANIQVVVDLAKIRRRRAQTRHYGCLHPRRRTAGRSRRVRAAASRCRPRRSRSTARPIPKPIPCRRRGTRWSSCATSPTCVRAPTPSVPCCASATPWPMPSTSISTNRVSTISIRRSSRLRTARAPARCSR